jgi:hypothetical protein
MQFSSKITTNILTIQEKKKIYFQGRARPFFQGRPAGWAASWAGCDAI